MLAFSNFQAPASVLTELVLSELLSELIYLKLPGEDGAEEKWVQEDGAGGGINRFKPFTTADTIHFGSTDIIDQLGAEVDKVTGGRWFDTFLLNSSISTLNSINFFRSAYLIFQPSS